MISLVSSKLFAGIRFASQMSFIAFIISTAALRDAVKPAMAEISSMRDSPAIS
jgi:hypothetical protein